MAEKPKGRDLINTLPIPLDTAAPPSCLDIDFHCPMCLDRDGSLIEMHLEHGHVRCPICKYRNSCCS